MGSTQQQQQQRLCCCCIIVCAMTHFSLAAALSPSGSTAWKGGFVARRSAGTSTSTTTTTTRPVAYRTTKAANFPNAERLFVMPLQPFYVSQSSSSSSSSPSTALGAFPRDDRNNSLETTTSPPARTGTTTTAAAADLATTALFATVSFLYWYWLVLGGLGHTLGWPGIPDFVPSEPGWPPTDAQIRSIADDSAHFFYIADVLKQGGDAELPIVPAWRLAFFNSAEAWIVAFLPLLWKDRWRAPRPVLLLTWMTVGVFLTNSFLAPYLLLTQVFGNDGNTSATSSSIVSPDYDQAQGKEEAAVIPGKSRVISACFAAVSGAVVLYAMTSLTADGDNIIAAWLDAWSSWWEEARNDRSVLAYGVDLCLFSVFQPLLLGRVRNQEFVSTSEQQPQQPFSDYVPFWGLVLWMLQ